MRVIRSSTLVFHFLLMIVLGGGLAIIGQNTLAHGVWLGLLPVFVIGIRLGTVSFGRWSASRRRLSNEQKSWLEDAIPFYQLLTRERKKQFHRDIQLFLHEQTFEGAMGQVATEQLQLAVAAGAALMMHGRSNWTFGRSRSFIFYPDRFDEDYFDTDYASYDGMVHSQGAVILSAKAVLSDWASPGTGHNVVVHELAHLFDMQSTGAAGVPTLMSRSSEQAWSKLVREEMLLVRQRRSLLRPYAAKSPAEFFAVSVESFFDNPFALIKRHPDLFNALKAFFNLDPRGGENS